MKAMIAALLIYLGASFLFGRAYAQAAVNSVVNVRPTAAVQVVNAADFGVKCDGGSDDTASIQTALNKQYVYNLPLTNYENVVVQLPQGSCLISRPLQMGYHGSLVGQGDSTYLVANYQAWSGTDHNAIEMVTSSPNPGGASIGSRRIGNFNLIGILSSKISNATGIYIANSANVYDPNLHAFNNLSIDSMKISGFDTAVEAQDLTNSQIQFVNISSVRLGLNFNGDVQNIFLSHNTIESGLWNATSNHSATIGLNIVQNTKYGTNCGAGLYCAPQGIFLDRNTILAFDYDINVGQCNQCNFSDNTIDEAAGGPKGSGAAIQLGPQANGGGGIWIARNYIGVLNPSNTYGIYSTLNTNTNHNGIWITDNYFLLDNQQKPTNVVGMKFAGSATLYNAHITGNIFADLSQAIVAAQPLVEGVISGNAGSAIQADLINLSSAASLNHYGTVVENNTDTDAIPVINEGSAIGFRLGYNMSGPYTAPTQLTGTQQATGKGCNIPPGTPLTACTATVSFPTPYPDQAYIIQGCQIVGASANAIAGVVGSKAKNQFTLDETVLSAGGVTGGSIYCQIVHN